MSSTTAIELTPPAPPPNVAPTTRHTALKHEPPYSTPTSDNGDDEILRESREADLAVPEGGYGWVVVAAGAVLLWWSLGTTYAWGVVQSALVAEDLVAASPAVLSFIGSLQAALISALAVANSRVMRKLGARLTGMLGAACMGGSEVLSGFAVRSVGGLFVTSGVLMGLGIR